MAEYRAFEDVDSGGRVRVTVIDSQAVQHVIIGDPSSGIGYTSVPVTGSIGQAGAPWSVTGSQGVTQLGAPWSVTGSQGVTQLGAPWTVVASVIGQPTVTASVVGIPTVSGSVEASQAGAWTVQQGTPPWTVTGSTEASLIATSGTDAGQLTATSFAAGRLLRVDVVQAAAVAGTVTANQGGAPWSQVGSVEATQAGAWNVGQSGAPWSWTGSAEATLLATSGTDAGQLTATSVTGGRALRVDVVKTVVAGGGDGAILDGVDASVKAWVSSHASGGHLHVIVDSTAGGGSTITGSVGATQLGAPWTFTGSTQASLIATSGTDAGQLTATSNAGGRLLRVDAARTDLTHFGNDLIAGLGSRNEADAIPVVIAADQPDVFQGEGDLTSGKRGVGLMAEDTGGNTFDWLERAGGALLVVGSQGVTQLGAPWTVTGSTQASLIATSGTDAGQLTATSFADGRLLRVDVVQAAAVTGTVTANQGGAPWSVTGSVGATQLGAPWTVTGSTHVTQGTDPWTVDGTVTANQGGAPWTVTGSTQASLIATSGTDAGQLTVTSWADGRLLRTDVLQSALPAGAATEATLGTIDTSLNAIEAGYAADGTAYGSGVLIQGDDGADRRSVLVDAAGHLQVDVLTGGGTTLIASMGERFVTVTSEAVQVDSGYIITGRQRIIVQNVGTIDVPIGHVSTMTASEGLRLRPWGNIDQQADNPLQYWARVYSGSQTVRVVEYI